MFYRKKILLALLEAFGGRLGKTDCQKLLMLFCKQTGKDHYEFFPYKYGGFSFLVYADKTRLRDTGHLRDADAFELERTDGYVRSIRPGDQAAIRSFAQEYCRLRGRQLIRHAYLRYPWYASRSEIAREVLDQAELERVASHCQRRTAPCLYTIGYEGLSIDGYLDRLIASDVRLLVDVRQNPLSRKHGFSKAQLKAYVEKAGLRYAHLPGLGVPSHLRRNLVSDSDYQQLFRHYEAEILPMRTVELDLVSQLVSDHLRVALTCFEAEARRCHRHKIAEKLAQSPGFGAEVAHL